jgi:hypothetical protein
VGSKEGAARVIARLSSFLSVRSPEEAHQATRNATEQYEIFGNREWRVAGDERNFEQIEGQGRRVGGIACPDSIQDGQVQPIQAVARSACVLFQVSFVVCIGAVF